VWQAERPDTDGSSVAILTRALLIGRHLTRARERALEELGTDTPTLDVLAALRGSGAPYRLRTSEIEAASPVTAGAITRRLDRLQARGLVSRERDRRDKRVIHVRPHRQGARPDRWDPRRPDGEGEPFLDAVLGARA
jgi:DNA-binding MarR family transcriptional regulator